MNDENQFSNSKNNYRTYSNHPFPKRKMTNEEINDLPLHRYDGKIAVIRTDKEITAMVSSLYRESVLGFDIEIRPAFKKGQSYPPSLLQLAGQDTVYLLRLAGARRLPADLVSLLETKNILKAGVSINFDIVKLQEIGQFSPHGFIDLAAPAKEAGLKNFGLRGLAALLLGYRIPKGAQRTNWANENLTEKQIRYAATDAWAGREIYLEMVRRKMVNDGAGTRQPKLNC